MKTKQITLSIKLKEIKITDNKTLEQATLYLSNLNQQLDRITEDRERITKPLNASLKEIRAKYRPYETQLTQAIQEVRDQMSAYATNLATLKAKEEEKIEAKLEAGKLNVMQALNKLDAIPRVPDTTTSSAGSLSFRPKNTLVITDSTIIPNIYMLPNEKSILEALEKGIEVKGCKLVVVQIPFNTRS